MNYIKKIIKKAIPQYFLEIKNNINISFSQDGEDLIIDKLLHGKENGFYVDIGAHHPFRFSNTYKFYRRGWKGINIEASPSLMDSFNKYRLRDINVNALVSDSAKEMDFFIFTEQALNTTQKAQVDDVLVSNNKDWQLKDTIKVQSQTLANILDNYVSNGQCIDFITVDCEGHDLAVLKSNNWDKYSPKVLICEIKDDIENLINNDIYIFLVGMGYKLVTKQLFSTIFIKV